jgi:hypothetical protein
MADADVKFDGAKTTVEGNWLEVKCWDIKLDGPGRRSSTTGERRAMVHGFNDEVVINYNKDYPGGVTIKGSIGIPDKIKQDYLRLESHDLYLDHPARRSNTSGSRRALVHGFNDELVLNYNKDYPGGVTIRGSISIPDKIKQDYLRLESHDLYLDHPDRRSNTSGYRRALVHGFNDELVLNWHGDYPGNVAVHSNLEIQRSKKLQIKKSDGNVAAELNANGDLVLGGTGSNGDISLMDSDGKEKIAVSSANDRIDFKDTTGTVKVRIDAKHFTNEAWPAWPDLATPTRLDLISEMRKMKEEILALREELDALQAGG